MSSNYGKRPQIEILPSCKTIGFSKIKQFLQNGTEYLVPSSTNLHILSAWEKSTLLGHNCAVKKYLAFSGQRGRTKFNLPLSAADVEDFCMWAGRNNYISNPKKINATTLKKYLVGLKAWHTFHAVRFPDWNRDRLTLILKGSTKADKATTNTRKKPAVMLWHLVFLYNTLCKGSNFDRALADLVLVAFWGLARLSELTYDSDAGDVYHSKSILTSDVTFSPDGTLPRTVLLTVRGAKTAGPGESQLIALGSQPNVLCPVRAVERRLAETGSTPTSLFGYNAGSVRMHLTRRRAVDRIQQVLFDGGHEHLLGHSFRVGGASFRNAYGMSSEDICRIGRWVSSCYRVYLRQYSQQDVHRTSKLLSILNSAWRRIDV
ncbi:hypothetical protein MJO29_016915 [Puccinia striiformis f. sp. tritici]|uniref:Tyr recombinase domain-containing protein n=1 Tax=Puccinia striiformis f. sp. tritici PST-78 TaxID=1165861 RepID=A0A0L0VNN3_9BASI|nr:hypothetical protein MJO29_016915 [Puccinia striiformis f. sp. tritici]KNF00884.1 hypothetical protein PSTG_05776 [Puccinia striiformis f. sp. tritici PST-78]